MPTCLHFLFQQNFDHIGIYVEMFVKSCIPDFDCYRVEITGCGRIERGMLYCSSRQFDDPHCRVRMPGIFVQRNPDFHCFVHFQKAHF